MYNYREEIKKDIVTAFENGEYESFDYDSLYDVMWIDDSITGNASGSYTFNHEQAKEYVLDNMEIAVNAVKEFDCVTDFVDKLANEEYEWIDVTIRCYLLSECLQEVLDENDFE